MEPLQKIDKFYSSPLIIFWTWLTYLYLFVRNRKTFHLFCVFYHHDLAMLCVYLAFIAYDSNTLFNSFFTPLCCCVINIQKVKFWLLEIQVDDIYAHQKTFEQKIHVIKKYITWMEKREHDKNISYWTQIYFDWIKLYFGIIWVYGFAIFQQPYPRTFWFITSKLMVN